MSDQEPPVPPPLPKIPEGLLWATLLAPPALTLGLNLIFMLTPDLVGYSLLTPLASLVAISVGLVHFLRALRVRYRDRSVATMGWGYLIGQIFICLAAWLGSCVTLWNV